MPLFKSHCSPIGFSTGLAILLLLSASADAQVALRKTSESRQEQNATRYFDQLREIPVMPRLSAVEDAASVFDKPVGRIVHVRAKGRNVSFESIRTFYAKTLPALGWQQRDAYTYIRDGEKLTLDFDRDGRKIILDLSVKPRQSKR